MLANQVIQAHERSGEGLRVDRVRAWCFELRESERERARASKRERERARSREGGSGRALPTETKVESGTSQSKSGISVDLSNSGERRGDPGSSVLEQQTGMVKVRVQPLLGVFQGHAFLRRVLRARLPNKPERVCVYV